MTAVKLKEIIDELMGTKCRCGANKKTQNTFCGVCFHKLPKPMKYALYKRVGDGYEEAYLAAVAHLFGEGTGNDDKGTG